MTKIINFPKLGCRIELDWGKDQNYGFMFGFNIWKPGVFLGIMNYSGYFQFKGGSND